MEAEATTSGGARPSPSAGRRELAAAGTFVGELFAEYGRMVFGLCRMLLRDGVEAEDATQQVFLSAHRAVLAGLRPRDPPAWLAAIARNECRARIRARMREPLALPELPSDLPDPLAAAIRAGDLDAVWRALSDLPRRQRRALVLRELGGLSYEELGRALGVSQPAVESLLFRARRHLRSILRTAGAVTVPFALRDDLARVIPGFDSATVGSAAGVAGVPLAVKIATAAVGVGVVATGAGVAPHHGAAPVTAPAHALRPKLAAPHAERHVTRPLRTKPHVATEHARPAQRTTRRAAHRREPAAKESHVRVARREHRAHETEPNDGAESPNAVAAEDNTGPPEPQPERTQTQHGEDKSDTVEQDNSGPDGSGSMDGGADKPEGSSGHGGDQSDSSGHGGDD